MPANSGSRASRSGRRYPRAMRRASSFLSCGRPECAREQARNKSPRKFPHSDARVLRTFRPEERGTRECPAALPTDFIKVCWCCRTGLNCRPLPYQGSALPLSYGSKRDGPQTRGLKRRRLVPQPPRQRQGGPRRPTHRPARIDFARDGALQPALHHPGGRACR